MRTRLGELRFTRIAELVEGVSQRMLTKTLRQIERDGLVERKVYSGCASTRGVSIDGAGR